MKQQQQHMNKADQYFLNIIANILLTGQLRIIKKTYAMQKNYSFFSDKIETICSMSAKTEVSAFFN